MGIDTDEGTVRSRPEVDAAAPPGWESERLTAQLLRPGNEALLQLVFSAAADFFQRVSGTAGPAPDAAEQEIAACARTPGREIAMLSTLDSGEPVGVIGWWMGNPSEDTALLGMLMMIPDRRGEGLARESVRGLERWLVGRGIRRIRTAVAATAFSEHRLLRALGFELLPVREHTALGMAGSHLMLWEKPIGDMPAEDGESSG